MHHTDAAIGLQQQGRHGLADDVGATHHHGVQAAQVTEGFVQQAHATAGRAGCEDLVALHQPANVFTMKPVHVLDRRNGLDHRLFIDVRRQWQLHQNAVHARVGVEALDQLQHLLLADIVGQAVLQ